MPPLRGAPYRERTLFIPAGGEAEEEGGVGGERVERKEGRTSEPEARVRTASSLSSCKRNRGSDFPSFSSSFSRARIIREDHNLSRSIFNSGKGCFFFFFEKEKKERREPPSGLQLDTAQLIFRNCVSVYYFI